ncbi:MAG: carboxylesterase/lipase family protein [Acidobacteria bacterium]|nr:carboxylesterase/lipase family protein [Acidobacteriota bacterium]
MLKTGVSRREFVVGASAAALSVSGLWAQDTVQPVATATAVVKAPCGRLRGDVVDGVRVFRGVPFAEPPLGRLRFKPPLKLVAWKGERNATKFASAAMQDGEKNVPQSEDCLYLNVWTPQVADVKAGLPVFVWIHGGGYTGGDAFSKEFDGGEFAREGVIVVTLAYRLGVFGFVDMEPLLGEAYAGSANNALRDLLCGLEWVKDNIAAFGGDPARVTVGGESAGAKLTDDLMGIPQAQGLFSQMISESGGAERIWPKRNAQAVGKGFGDIWGASRLQQLKTAPADELIAAQVKFIAGWPQHFPLRPEIDGDVMPDWPLKLIAAGSAKGKRLLIGTNRDESSLFIGPHPQHDPTAADLGNMTLAKFDEVYAKYKALYPQMTAQQLRIRAVTAEEYWVPSVRVADAQVKGGGEVWMYRLDFAHTDGRMKGEAYHSEDVGLVWNKPQMDIENVAQEVALARQMHDAWVAFMKGETPGARGLAQWPRYTLAARETMVLDTVSRVEERPQENELRLWDGMLEA